MTENEFKTDLKEKHNIDLTDEIIKRTELAYKLSKQVVENLKLPDIKERKTREYDDKNHYLYKFDNGEDILLFAEINSSAFGYIDIKFSLTFPAYDAIYLLQLILSDETAHQMFKSSVTYEIKKRNIDILTLFDLEKSEVKDVIEEHTKGILEMFLANLPNFAEAAVVDSYGHSKIGYYQHRIKPMMKEYWEKLGLPNDFELVTQDQLDEVRKYDLGRKRWFLGDKKQMLNLETLSKDADNLRLKYGKAKTRFIECNKSFDTLNIKEDRIDKWNDIWQEEFPALHPKAMDMIENFRPFELARIHLAEVYGYNEETMKKKITESRKLNRKKAKTKSKSKDE